MSRAVTSEVKLHGGRPVLFVNGAPHPGCQFWHSKPLEADEDFRRFAAAGVHLMTVGFAAGLRPDGTWDVSRIGPVMDRILAADPQALVMPRIWLEPPDWWFQQYPDERQVHYDVVSGDEIRRGVTFASPRWHADMGAALPALLRTCEERWGDHLLGYHPCAGDCGEWSYRWAPVLSGYSPVQRDAFRAWLRARYGGDVAALRRAWADPAASFETVEVPRRERARNPNAWPREWSCFRPDTERRVVDYLEFHSAAVADAIVLLEGPAIVANAGHHALHRVLESPDVDLIAVPYTYSERQAGGLYHVQTLPATIALHGKLCYAEDDTFTHRAKFTLWRPRCRDAAETADVLWRNFAGALREGSAYWWMDHDGEGWYRDDGLMREVAGMQRLAGDLLARERPPSAQMAVLLSQRSQDFLRYDSAWADALVGRQLSELSSVGAPFDLYALEDLERLLDQPWSGQYRLVLVPDALYLTVEQRRALRERLCRGGRTVVWAHGVGLLTDEGVSPEAMSAVTGIRVERHDRAGSLKAHTCVTGTWLSYGTDRDVGPELVGVAADVSPWPAEASGSHALTSAATGASAVPGVECLGWSLYRGEPMLLRRRFADWTSIWTGAPALPAQALRVFAREAGVHIWCDTGDRVYADRDLLAVHATFDGERTIALPKPCRVRGVRGEPAPAGPCTELRLSLRRGQTAVFRLEAQS
jgi:hypothetical protein